MGGIGEGYRALDTKLKLRKVSLPRGQLEGPASGCDAILLPVIVPAVGAAFEGFAVDHQFLETHSMDTLFVRMR